MCGGGSHHFCGWEVSGGEKRETNGSVLVFVDDTDDRPRSDEMGWGDGWEGRMANLISFQNIWDEVDGPWGRWSLWHGDVWSERVGKNCEEGQLYKSQHVCKATYSRSSAYKCMLCDSTVTSVQFQHRSVKRSRLWSEAFESATTCSHEKIVIFFHYSAFPRRLKQQIHDEAKRWHALIWPILESGSSHRQGSLITWVPRFWGQHRHVHIFPSISFRVRRPCSAEHPV